MADEKEAVERQEMQIQAKLAQYDVLQQKVQMMEQDKDHQDAAVDILS